MNKPANQALSAWRRLLAYGAPYTKGFALAFLLLMLSTAFEMLSPWLMKIMLDDYIAAGDYDVKALAVLGAVMVLSTLASSVFLYIQGVMFQDNALEVIHDIRQKVFSHMLKLPMKFFDSHPTGQLVSRLTNDSETLRQMFMAVMPALLRGVVKIVGIFIALALLDFRLMLMSLALIPVLLSSVYLYQKISHPLMHGVRARLADINTRLNESLQTMRIIQAMGQEGNKRRQFEESNQQWSRLRHKSINVDSLLLMPFSHLVQTLALAGIVAWFGWKSGSDLVEVGTLYAFINYLGRFFEPFRQITMQLGNLQQSIVSAERVFAVLDEEPDNEAGQLAESSEQSSENQPVHKGRIEFKNVSLSYDGQHQALNDVSFCVEPGQFTAIVGHSGSGKSSVINLLMRFYQHQQGQVQLDDCCLEAMDETALRQCLGLVFQEPYIFSGSLMENIRLGNPAVTSEDAVAAAHKVHADQFISRLESGYDHQPGAGGQSLSIGERQLLSFSRTVAQDPRILLLDEATANIDGETEQLIKEALITLREGRTTIAVAHRLSTIQDADQILVMDKGRITQRGRHEELLAQPGHYRDLYLAQQTEEQLQEAEVAATESLQTGEVFA